MNPAAHTHDPATSHEAARRVTDSGRRGHHADIVFGLVSLNPGKTAVELWQCAGPEIQSRLREKQEVRRRLTDLLATGRIRRGEPRICVISGTRQVTWFSK